MCFYWLWWKLPLHFEILVLNLSSAIHCSPTPKHTIGSWKTESSIYVNLMNCLFWSYLHIDGHGVRSGLLFLIIWLCFKKSLFIVSSTYSDLLRWWRWGFYWLWLQSLKLFYKNEMHFVILNKYNLINRFLLGTPAHSTPTNIKNQS